MRYKSFIFFTCIFFAVISFCNCQAQQGNLKLFPIELAQTPIKPSQNGNSYEWTKMNVPMGKTAEVISFGNQGLVAIAGRGVLLFSVDNGRSWQSVNNGKGNELYTTDGGITYQAKKDEKSKKGKLSLLNIEQLCSAESMVFNLSGRLHIYSMCEHHTELWSVPTKSLSEPWYIYGFGPSITQHERSDNPEYFTPYNHLTVVGERVLISAVLPKGVSLLATDNNGMTWFPIWQEDIRSRIVGLDFVNEQEGWMLLDNGKILRTINGGRNWSHFSQLPLNAIGKVSSIDFANSVIGFVVGEKGLILITNDAGKTWKQQISNTENFLHKVVSANEKKIWVVGENATVLETEDGGNTWRKIQLDIDDDPFNTIYNLTVKDGKAWIVKDKFIYHSP